MKLRLKYVLFVFLIVIITAFILPSTFSRTIQMRYEAFPKCLIVGEDRRPLFIKIYVKPEFKSSDDVRLYIEARKNLLNELMAQDGKNNEAWVSFIDNTPIEQLEGIVVEYSIRVVAVQGFAVDAQGKYLYTFGRDLSADNKEINIKEFIRWAKTPEPNFDVAHFRINFIRGTLSTSKALLLRDDPRVLLVDPISDLIQLFAGQALYVQVESMPQPAVYIDLFGG